MPRERREFKRESFSREIQRLFIIATEGQKTEAKYFEEFKNEQEYTNQKIFIEVLKRITTSSSPTSVVKQLSQFKSEYNLKEGDELWMVIDRDKQSWSADEIADVARLCHQKKFGFALSNPCFEVWLLLHRKDLNEYSIQELEDIFNNAKTGKRTKIEQELVAICGRYNKSNLSVEDYLPFVRDAIQRAEALVQHPNERWPINIGSHVFKLVLRLLP